MKRYTRTHEWIEVDGKVGRVGITNYAQDQLGDIVFVELPEIGKELRKGEVLCTVESVKSASDVYAPVSGKVVEVNVDLDSQPEKINKDAEGEGWIAKMELSNPSELDELMTKEEYEKFCSQGE